VKVRIGFGLGTQGLRDDGDLATVVDGLERLGFDSLWLSERVTGPAPDPIVALAFAAGRTRNLKFGTSVLVVPGRNPALLAKELATLDVLSGGRLLPAVGLGTPDPAEHQAFGVDRGERAAWFEEALPLMRRLWTEDGVDHDGDRFTYKALTVRPKPLQSPIDVWLGGLSPSELRRTGRLGDGWLPSFCTPEEAAAGRVVIEEAAAGAGRAIDPEHYGALIPYVHGHLPDRLVAALSARRPGVDPSSLIPSGLDGLRAAIERFVDHGVSKFVVVPVVEPADWDDELGALADGLMSLQT
jgi:probable F420-dependent oxidoreductase